MIGHKSNNSSAPLNVNVVTTPEWSAARKLNIQQFMPRELPPSPANIAIGQRLRIARLAFGYDGKQQGKFAEVAGIQANTYNQWEKGAHPPGLQYAIQLCRKHDGLSLDWIYRGKKAGMPTSLSKRILELEAAAEPSGPPPSAADVPMRVVQAKRRRRVA